MNAAFLVRLGMIAASAIGCSSLAPAQAPSTGIDLGSLTPKTPSQKAAADANAATAQSNQKTGVVGSTLSSPGTGQPVGQGTSAKGALSKSGLGVVGGPGSGNAKSAPVAAEDTTSSSTDVQVKLPSSYKK